jgi:hypothetical protein
LGLAGFWLIPAIYEQRWVEIGRAVGPLMRVEDSFLFGYAKLSGVSADDRFDTDVPQPGAADGFVDSCRADGWGGRGGVARAKEAKCDLDAAGGGGCGCLRAAVRWSDVVWRLAPELKFCSFRGDG